MLKKMINNRKIISAIIIFIVLLTCFTYNNRTRETFYKIDDPGDKVVNLVYTNLECSISIFGVKTQYNTFRQWNSEISITLLCLMVIMFLFLLRNSFKHLFKRIILNIINVFTKYEKILLYIHGKDGKKRSSNMYFI